MQAAGLGKAMETHGTFTRVFHGFFHTLQEECRKERHSRSSEAELFLDMHIMVDPLTSVADSHHLMHELEARYRERLDGRVKEVIIHFEPWYANQSISHP